MRAGAFSRTRLKPLLTPDAVTQRLFCGSLLVCSRLALREFVPCVRLLLQFLASKYACQLREILRLRDLTVVIISRNQEWNVERLIRSVLAEISGRPGARVVLVDSASDDRTVEIACGFPIDVLRLRPDQQLSASAGRHVGTRVADGRFILFLDGDMELCNGWLDKAVDLMQMHPEVAAVTGQVIERLRTHGGQVTAIQNEQPGAAREADVKSTGGAGLYRRSILDSVGGFNPFLISDEEPELCLRIRHAGYRVACLSLPIVNHYSDPSDRLSTLIRRWRRNLYRGEGQALRYHFGDDLFWPYVIERGSGCVPGIGLCSGIICLFGSAISGQWLWAVGWLFVMAAVVVGTACRKRSLYKAVFSVLQRSLILEGTLRGLLSSKRLPQGYPTKVDVVKRTE